MSKPLEIGIVGLGLLGGSLARGLKQHSPAIRITGVSSEKSLAKALDKKWIDRGIPYQDINSILIGDLVFLCTPINQILATLSQWEKHLPTLDHPVVVTDVGSTKNLICKSGLAIQKNNRNFRFIGSHPMAGSEKQGLDAADPHLFENAPWIFCPLEKKPESAMEALKKVLLPLGIHPMELDPDLHDGWVSRISHLPQILSSSLAGYFLKDLDQHGGALSVSGPGFRDMTRLSHSPLSVWEPIFNTNHENISTQLQGFSHYFKDLAEAFSNRQYEEFFNLQSKWPPKSHHFWKGTAPRDSVEIRLTCADEPGELARILAPLSRQKINVKDIEVLKNREMETGTIRLLLPDMDTAKKALHTLEQNHIRAEIKL